MIPFVADPDFTLYVGDVLDVLHDLPDEHVHCAVTSPPYWGLRDYGVERQLGLEATPEEYVARMVAVFREVRRVLRRDGTLWLNIGDSVEKKNLVGIPWRLAFALQADGWYLRADIIWSKPNPMPESVTDRPTKAHEYLFLLARSPRYFYDGAAIAEPAAWERWGDQTVGTGSNPNGWIKPKSKQELVGESRPAGRGDTYSGFNGRYAAADPAERKTKNKRDVWEIATEPYHDAHFATFPQALVESCVKAGCPFGGTVLDPFMGSGTTALVARRRGRKSIGIELNPKYAAMCAKRLSQLSLLADAP